MRLGPLAPRRAVGKTEIEDMGSLDQMRIIHPTLPWEHRIRCWNIVEKDRVVVLTGPDRHKIGAIKSVDKSNNTLTVEGLNIVPMKIPEVYAKLDPNHERIYYREAPIHYNDVRLVIPMPDKDTGEFKDTIVANISMSKVFHDRQEGTRRWTRYVAGTTYEIPWPEKKEKHHFDQDPDTRIMDVEKVTYTPTLLKPPFPVSIIDELRNKYSKFRVRHEPEFVAKVEAAETARQEKKEWRVRTPLQELNKVQREARKAKGQPVLTEEIMEMIGKTMAKNKPELLTNISIHIASQGAETQLDVGA